MSATTTRHRAPASPVAATAPRRRQAQPLAGAGAMIRLVLRRNRVRLLVWLVVVAGLFAYVAEYYRGVLDDQRALDGFAAVSDTPAIKAITGLAAAANTLGGAVWTKIWMTCALTLAIAVVFLVTRNGRADEEAGRVELVRSRPLGIHASSAASWAVTAALCLVVGVAVALSSEGLGLAPAGAGPTGSLLFGASIAGVGWFGLGVGALAGQLSSTARGANGLALAALGACYAVRMVGDVGDGTLTWFSPIGWGQEMQPWGANRWWPLALLVALALVLLAVAVWFEGRRDLGAGVLADRPGPESAPQRFVSPLWLSLHQQRGAIIGWGTAILLFSVVLGSVIQAMRDLLSDATPQMAAVFGGTGIDSLLAMLCLVTALLVTAFAVQSTTVLRADEADGIIEAQLVGAISRRRWALSRLAIPAGGAAVLLFAAGGVMGVVYGAMIGDAGQIVRLGLATLAYWPAAMVLCAVGVAAFGWLPRLTGAFAWGVFGAMWVVTLVGESLHLPERVLDDLPFSATPSLPLDAFHWTPLVVLTLVAVALSVAGVERFVRRDVQVG